MQQIIFILTVSLFQLSCGQTYNKEKTTKNEVIKVQENEEGKTLKSDTIKTPENDGLDCNLTLMKKRDVVSFDNEKLYVYVNWKAHLIRYEKTLNFVEKSMEKANSHLKNKDITNASYEFNLVIDYLNQKQNDILNLKSNSITDKLDELFFCYYASSYNSYQTVSQIIKQKKPFNTIAAELKNIYETISSEELKKRIAIKAEVEKLDLKYNLSAVKVTKN